MRAGRRLKEEKKRMTQLATMYRILDPTRTDVPAQLREVQHVINGLDERRPARLDGLQERRLAVVKMRLGQQFRGGKNLTKRV